MTDAPKDAHESGLHARSEKRMKVHRLNWPPQPSRTPCKKTLSLPVISSREYLRAVYGLDTIYTHSLAYTIDRCTKEMPTFMSTYAQMSTQHSCGHPGRTQAMAAAASARPKPQPPLLRDVAIAMAIAAILHA